MEGFIIRPPDGRRCLSPTPTVMSSVRMHPEVPAAPSGQGADQRRISLHLLIAGSFAMLALSLTAALGTLANVVATRLLKTQIERELLGLAHQTADRLARGMAERLDDIESLAMLQREAGDLQNLRGMIHNLQQAHPE